MVLENDIGKNVIDLDEIKSTINEESHESEEPEQMIESLKNA